MALIKCNECGKEISNKAKICIHCGNPIFKESVKIMKKKKWEELSAEEKLKINAYRKTINQWWIVNRIATLIFAIIAGIFLLIFFTSGLNTTFLFMSFIPLSIEIICSISSTKEEKIWYENHIDELYEEEIIK